MSETARTWVEVVFNVSYLAVVWSLVILMIRRRPAVAAADRPVAVRLIWAFALLALGDTGHVGFRVVAYALGVMAIVLSDAFRTGDAPFKWIGAMIALSYTFYAPVILWVTAAPMLGMLMIPKTCAYVAVAIIAYRALFVRQPAVSTAASRAGRITLQTVSKSRNQDICSRS